MKRRVTITLDPAIHARARQVARARRTTVSGLIEGFLRVVPASKGAVSLVDEMVGSAELREPMTSSDPLFDALHRRHVARGKA